MTKINKFLKGVNLWVNDLVPYRVTLSHVHAAARRFCRVSRVNHVSRVSRVRSSPERSLAVDENGGGLLRDLITLTARSPRIPRPSGDSRPTDRPPEGRRSSLMTDCFLPWSQSLSLLPQSPGASPVLSPSRMARPPSLHGSQALQPYPALQSI